MEIPKIRYTIDEEDLKSTDKYIIYGLLEPETLNIFYIGRSSSGLKRPKSHFSNSLLRKQCPLSHKILKLFKNNIIPGIVILDFTDNPEKLNGLETLTIAEAKNEGEALKNLTDGGGGIVGYKRSEESKRKMSELMKARKITFPPGALAKAIHTNKTRKRTKKESEVLRDSSWKRIPVMCDQNKKFYKSAREAAQDLGIKCHKCVLWSAKTGKSLKNGYSFKLLGQKTLGRPNP